MHARIPGPSSAHVSSSKPSTPPSHKLAQPAPHPRKVDVVCPALPAHNGHCPPALPHPGRRHGGEAGHTPLSPPCSKIEPPATTPTALRLAKPGPFSAHPGHQEEGMHPGGQPDHGLGPSPLLAHGLRPPHSRHSNKVVTTPKGLHHLAIVGKYNLRTISKSNEKPKGPGTSTRYRLASSSSLQRVR